MKQLGPKIASGVLFAASIGMAVKSVLDIRALKKEEKENMEENTDGELRDSEETSR